MPNWDERYAVDDFLFGREPNEFLRSQAWRLHAGQSALAVADGEGRNGVWLARQGLDVLSVDISSVALAKAQGLAAEYGVALRTEQADLAQWDFGQERFDVVVAIFIQFAAPPERPRLHAGMRAALRPGGLLILQGYTPKQIEYGTGGPPCADNMYDAAFLRREFAGFEILHLREHEATIREGRGHSGHSALVDLVARKPLDQAIVGEQERLR